MSKDHFRHIKQLLIFGLHKNSGAWPTYMNYVSLKNVGTYHPLPFQSIQDWRSHNVHSDRLPRAILC